MCRTSRRDNTVILVEHDMQVIAASDWMIDMGPCAGDEGGRIAAADAARDVMNVKASRSATYLRQTLRVSARG